MSRIQQLIQQYCPDGVEYAPLGNIADLIRGKVISKDYIKDNEGEYPVYSSQSANDGVLGRINTYMYDGDFLTWTTDGAYAGTVFRRSGKFNITNVCGLVSISNPNVNLGFLYYWLYVEAPKYVYRGMGNPKLMSNVMGTISVPIPPLPIQEEIARILDVFTELQAELQAELHKRLQQYNYYRDNLLSFEGRDDVEWKKLDDVASHYTGLTYKPSDVSKTNHGTLVLRSTNIQDERICYEDNVFVDMVSIPDRALAKAGDILICVRNGSKQLIGKAALIPQTQAPMAFGAFMTVLRATDINNKFLFYLWQSSVIKKQLSTNDAMPINQITNREFSKISVPVPSIIEQQKIVDILDRFDNLANDLVAGLPAEIEKRRQQYEYFRDKLLTFKRKEA